MSCFAAANANYEQSPCLAYITDLLGMAQHLELALDISLFFGH
jgi:hypothetical protein